LFSIEQTSVFKRWLAGLRDQNAYTRVRMQILRFQRGNFGDVKPVGEGVSETRLHFGPGYRLYFCRKGDEVVLLLAGGDKSSQNSDIRQAIAIKGEMEEQ
jgi:putative addiction module killer protein